MGRYFCAFLCLALMVASFDWVKAADAENKPAVEEVKPKVTCTRPNEEFSDCAVGEKCQRLCPGHCSGYFCIQVCQDGCRCKTGYVRDVRKQYECVLESKCSPPIKSCEDN